MNTDHAYITGKSHTTCQDYARSGNNWIMLSDGCSGSPDSDFGSRILVKSVENLINNGYPLFNMGAIQNLLQRAAGTVAELQLSPAALDATLLCAEKYNGIIRVLCAGDGAIIVGFTNGQTNIISVEYNAGYPFYLSYLLNESRRQQFEFHNSHCTINSWLRTESDNLFNPATVPGYLSYHNEFPNIVTMLLRSEQIQYVALLSDGIDSFTRELSAETFIQSDRIDQVEIISRLVQFRSVTGRYVQRRLSRVIKELSSKSCYAQDDLSYAVMHR